jgi:hypothetical protein
MDSLLLLHIQHQPTTMTFLFDRLSKDRIFQRVAVYTKKLTLDETLTLQILVQRIDELAGMDNT